MPRSPERASTGSPGSRRISAKTSSVMPMKVGRTRAKRLRRKANMGLKPFALSLSKGFDKLSPNGYPDGPASLRAGHIHLVEEVVRRRIHLVPHNLLAH